MCPELGKGSSFSCLSVPFSVFLASFFTLFVYGRLLGFGPSPLAELFLFVLALLLRIFGALLSVPLVVFEISKSLLCSFLLLGRYWSGTIAKELARCSLSRLRTCFHCLFFNVETSV